MIRDSRPRPHRAPPSPRPPPPPRPRFFYFDEAPQPRPLRFVPRSQPAHPRPPFLPLKLSGSSVTAPVQSPICYTSTYDIREIGKLFQELAAQIPAIIYLTQ